VEVKVSTTQTFTITGMTCGHCVQSVTEEVSEITGIRDVVVDLDSATLTFNSDSEIPRETVVAAVTEAGFSVAE
jgi:copper chaperone CopZ